MEEKNKQTDEEKKLNEDKNWIYVLILVFFVNHTEYVNIFNNVIVNAIFNLITGGTLLILFIYLFTKQFEKNKKIHNNLQRVLNIILTICGMGAACYNMGYALGQILASF